MWSSPMRRKGRGRTWNQIGLLRSDQSWTLCVSPQQPHRRHGAPRPSPLSAHTPGIHSPAPKIEAQTAALAQRGPKMLSLPPSIPLPGSCSSPPRCSCRLRNGMRCHRLPQDTRRNSPQILGSLCRDKKMASSVRPLLQKT